MHLKYQTWRTAGSPYMHFVRLDEARRPAKILCGLSLSVLLSPDAPSTLEPLCLGCNLRRGRGFDPD